MNSVLFPLLFRRSLREKFTKSRLVRSISGSNYNVQGSTKDLDELEQLVQEQQSTPPTAQRPSAFARLTQEATAQLNNSSPEYQHLRTKLQKSLSSEAVLESDTEGTPIRRTNATNAKNEAKLRPRAGGDMSGPALDGVSVDDTTVSSPTDSEQLVGVGELPPPSLNAKDADILLATSVEWPAAEVAATANALKRHTVHESMSYYSLCFPSPTPPQKVVSASAGASPSTPGDSAVVSSAGGDSCVSIGPNCSIPQIPFLRSIQRMSSISAYEVHKKQKFR